ncbi:MAG: redoxin domain-containing protein [Planctomycetota bacterium]|nr:redoxin domain-containing protein [Planctomycetota bacterium]
MPVIRGLRALLGPLVAMLLATTFQGYAGEGATLKAGDQAPKLSISKWLNGEAVENFEKGKIYVIECWATWCGPCKASIPHVSELNTRLKDKGVVIIGMNVSEQDTSKVEPFVKEMGDKMNYRVAMDADGKTAETWLAAAGRNSIPCAFIVDKEGKIAWIGHPMTDLDRILDELVAGTFDPKKQAELEAKREGIMRRFAEADKAGDVDKILALGEEFVALDPKAAPNMKFMKFKILLMKKREYAAAYAIAAELADKEFKDNVGALNDMAWTILDGQGIEKRDLDLALKAAVRADELTKHENAPILDTLARAYFEKGQTDKAIETQTLAVEKAAGNQELKDALAKTLAKYKEKAGAKK